MPVPLAAAFETAPRFWHLTPDARVECELCPRLCRLREGQHGFCAVRGRHADGLVLETRGTLPACKPIEAVPFFHFVPGARALVLAVGGRNLACRDREAMAPRWADRGASTRPPSVAAVVEEACRGRCAVVALVGDEPLTAHEYVLHLARACRAGGLHLAITTGGYACRAPRAELFHHVDAVNVELYGLGDAVYGPHCAASAGPVLETLEWVAHHGRTWLEVTHPIRLAENDSDREVAQLAAWMALRLGRDVPLHLRVEAPPWIDVEPPAAAAGTLSRARQLALAAGLRHVYGFHPHDPACAATCCDTCGHEVLERTPDGLARSAVLAGRCAACGSPLAGIHRPPVRLPA